MVAKQRYKIAGKSLHASVVFDTFWRFASERNAIHERRRKGFPQPWTENAILQKNKFCNVFRVLDRVTQFIIKEVIETGSQEPVDVVFRVVLFQIFTKIETYQVLEEKLGPLTWTRFNLAAYERVLRALHKKQAIFTAAYQKPPPMKYGYTEGFTNHLTLLEELMECDLLGQLRRASYIEDVFEWLLRFQGMGNFTAYQLLLNLSYTGVLNFSESDFVVAGIGARSGLSKMFPGIQLPAMEVPVIRWLADTQDQHFARLGLTFHGLGPDHIPMQLADIEHTLCEVDKYTRFVYPAIKATHGVRRTGTTKNGPFSPSPGPFPADVYLPRAWSHPDRKVLRIRPGGRNKPKKRYLVEKIVDHMREDGELYYLVHWEGYLVSDRTWESAEDIKEDAPGRVEDYEVSLATTRPRKRR